MRFSLSKDASHGSVADGMREGKTRRRMTGNGATAVVQESIVNFELKKWSGFEKYLGGRN